MLVLGGDGEAAAAALDGYMYIGPTVQRIRLLLEGPHRQLHGGEAAGLGVPGPQGPQGHAVVDGPHGGINLVQQGVIVRGPLLPGDGHPGALGQVQGHPIALLRVGGQGAVHRPVVDKPDGKPRQARLREGLALGGVLQVHGHHAAAMDIVQLPGDDGQGLGIAAHFRHHLLRAVVVAIADGIGGSVVGQEEVIHVPLLLLPAAGQQGRQQHQGQKPRSQSFHVSPPFPGPGGRRRR